MRGARLAFLLSCLLHPCNALAARSPNGITVQYFAYGSNLAASVRDRRGLSPLAARPGIARNQRLAFNQLGFGREPAFASLDPSAGGECHGCVFELSAADWLRICATEGVPFSYRVVEVPIETYDGSTVQAWSLRAVARAPRDLAPSARYLDLLREGSRELGLAPEWQTTLDGLAAAPGTGTGTGAGAATPGPQRRAEFERRRGATFV